MMLVAQVRTRVVPQALAFENLRMRCGGRRLAAQRRTAVAATASGGATMAASALDGAAGHPWDERVGDDRNPASGG